MAISRVRCTTEKAITPYTPTVLSTSARKPKQAISVDMNLGRDSALRCFSIV